MADLPEPLRAGFQKLGWNCLMQVQARAIPYILAHRDVMIQSRTGSGKTGAYLVPILQRINPEIERHPGAGAGAHPRAGPPGDPRSRSAGQRDERPQRGRLRRGRLRPAAGRLPPGRAPGRRHAGRILDHLLRRSLTLDQLKILIFDEADRMLSMGFYPDMKRVQRYLPRPADQHLHVLGHLPAARAGPGQRVHAQAGLPQPVQRPHPRDRDRARLLHRAGHGQGPQPGPHHRGGKPGLGADLLQHQASGSTSSR